MKEKCKNVSRYKGIREPKCCGGEGCKACWKIYNRKFVYNAIDDERDYQDSLWCGKNDVSGYLTMIREYSRRADVAFTDNKGDHEALHVVRKIAALAVRCMEVHGAYKR